MFIQSVTRKYSVLAVCLLLGLAQAIPAWAEELRYRATYRGVFSAGAEIAIADLVMRSQVPLHRSDYAETGMTASSEKYAYVEALYPIRYRFRSWYRPEGPGVLAFEHFEFGRPEDIEHKLIFVDRAEAPFVTRNIEADSGQLKRLERGQYRPPDTPMEKDLFDRLGLLQHVRAQQLKPGKVLDAQVTNGSELLQYRATVEKAETLTLAGAEWPALKLRFDGLERDRRDREAPAHRPVFIWVSDDPRHLPLLVESRHRLGRFRIELLAAPTVAQVAARD